MIIRHMWHLPHRFHPPSQPPKTQLSQRMYYCSGMLETNRKMLPHVQAGNSRRLASVFTRIFWDLYRILGDDAKVSIKEPPLGCPFGGINKGAIGDSTENSFMRLRTLYKEKI